MSETVYGYASTFCYVLIVCSLTRLISPAKSTSKILSLIIGVFMLLTVISPLLSFVSDFKHDEIQNSVDIIEDEISTEMDNSVLKKTGEYLTEYISKILDNSDIDYLNIEAVMTSNENSVIYVDRIDIYIEQSDKVWTEKIRESVLTAVGVEPTVIVKQDS